MFSVPIIVSSAEICVLGGMGTVCGAYERSGRGEHVSHGLIFVVLRDTVKTAELVNGWSAFWWGKF